MSKVSLRKKVFFLMSITVLIICGMNAVSFYRSYSQLNNMVNVTGLSLIKRAAGMVDLFFEQYRTMARDMAALYALLDGEGTFAERGEGAFAKYLTRFLEENKKFGVADIFIVSAKTGRLIDGAGRGENDTVDYRESSGTKTAWPTTGSSSGTPTATP